ncbi:hypothetical protein [Streptomyces sp. NPDC001678]|uniref:hypothetical protein n=1 Tax=Streptomyces sp. NPDC001678 TaxID=3364599 RepID=UPI0036BE71CE
MSNTSNRERAAKACAGATGVPLGRCRKWAREGLISPHQPVPDASSAPQRQLEAFAANTLANTFRDHQLDGSVLGVVKAEPSSDSLDLQLHPVMANHVIAALLPRVDWEYGGLEGVPGLRPRDRAGQLVLEDVSGRAALRITQPAGERLRLPQGRRGELAMWRKSPRRLHGSEEPDLSSWQSGSRQRERSFARDYLLSRMLRRPRLLNRAAKAHGFANSYTHGYSDLVVEWCCAASVEEMASLLRRSGLTAQPASLVCATTESFLGNLDLGPSRVVIRRLPRCTIPYDVISEEQLTATHREEYLR